MRSRPKRGQPWLVIMTVASGVIIYAFVAGDFTIRYVRRYSDSVQPLFYKITSYWGGLDGSVMFWILRPGPVVTR